MDNIPNLEIQIPMFSMFHESSWLLNFNGFGKKMESSYQIYIYMKHRVLEFHEKGKTELFGFVNNLEKEIILEDIRFYNDSHMISLDWTQKQVWNSQYLTVYINHEEYDIERIEKNKKEHIVRITKKSAYSPSYEAKEIIEGIYQTSVYSPIYDPIDPDRQLEERANEHFNKADRMLLDDCLPREHLKEIAKGIQFLLQKRYLALCPYLTKTMNPFLENSPGKYLEPKMKFSSNRQQMVNDICKKDIYIFRDYHVFQYDENTFGFYFHQNLVLGKSKNLELFKICHSKIDVISQNGQCRIFLIKFRDCYFA